MLSGGFGDVAGSKPVIYDLYTGTGTIAQMLSPVASKVIGVEIVAEAVEAAKKNAAQNGLTNCEFIADDVLSQISSYLTHLVTESTLRHLKRLLITVLTEWCTSHASLLRLQETLLLCRREGIRWRSAAAWICFLIRGMWRHAYFWVEKIYKTSTIYLIFQ